jgi:hypothetical protein
MYRTRELGGIAGGGVAGMWGQLGKGQDGEGVERW